MRTLPRCIQVKQNNTLLYTHDDSRPASVRTKQPVSSALGLFYFEFHISKRLSNSENRACFAIGLTREKGVNNKSPGREPGTIGYHGENGHVFTVNTPDGDYYGPSFEHNDKVGCCVNFVHKTVFFTKNGAKLSTLMFPLENETALFPTVSLNS